MRWIAAVALFVGCDGSRDPAQLADDSAPGAGAVWVDAAGDEVPGVVQLGELAYVDDGGAIWTLDPWAESPEDAFGTWATSHLLYTSNDCSEPWSDPTIALPRLVTEVDRVGESTGSSAGLGGELFGYYTANDAPEQQAIPNAYVKVGPECQLYDTSLRGYPLSQMRQVHLPDLSWVPPLHPELH
jgi:hypothetical protein